jgi:hypothetical protein
MIFAIDVGSMVSPLRVEAADGCARVMCGILASLTKH